MSIDLVWTVSHPTLTGAERCTVHGTDEGWVLAGVVVAVFEGRPIDVRYRVTVDELWVTRTVSVAADELGKAARLDLVRSNTGTWTVDGQAAPELDGCVDVDLGITPVTNTLPIRRLDLEVGAEQEIDVAWVKFPHLRVERGRQRYARLAPETWRYSSEAFTADLAVDENGLVVRYGHDLWRRVEGAR